MEMYNFIQQQTSMIPTSSIPNHLLFTNPLFTLAGSPPVFPSAHYFQPSTVFPTIQPVAEIKEEPESSSSPEQSISPSSSPRQRVKRGRPQQEIQDDEDPSSQKRKHRRLYARQYRAQMRSQIEEVKKLHDDIGELKLKHQKEIANLNQTIMELLRINQQLIPAVMMNTTQIMS